MLMVEMQKQQVLQTGLHVEQTGDGLPVIFLHGWGMHGGVFEPLKATLSSGYQCNFVDLPGHGNSADFDSFADVRQLSGYIVEELRELFARGAILVGWSMGGLIAQAIAGMVPESVNKLVLITGTPCFAKHAHWQFGVENAALEKFANELLSDYDQTLRRFLALQFMGSDRQKESLRAAKELVFSKSSPRAAMLAQGLELLKRSDLRENLKDIRCPAVVINGERDSLIPVMAARYMAETIPRARAVIIKGAGHAPFLSHNSNFTAFFERFLNG